MSWHFSQALVEAFWAENCSAGGRSAPSRSTDTHVTSCCHGKTTDASIRSRSGMTFAHSRGNPGEDLLTWFRAVSRVRIFPSQEKGSVSREKNQDCGERCIESFARFDHVTHSWKTPQRSLLGGLEPFLVTWPRQGMMRHGWCSARMIWAPHMSARDGGVSHMIPTPTACNAPNAHSNTRGPHSLLEVARTQWTPGKQWMPTPTCQDAKNRNTLSQLRRNSPPLCAVVGGTLNPQWVEWLMGWPIGWTDCDASATDRFRAWQQGHSSFCLIVSTIRKINEGNAKTLPRVTEKR